MVLFPVFSVAPSLLLLNHPCLFERLRYEEELIEAIVETVKDYYENECIKGYIVDSALRKMVCWLTTR